MPPLTLTSCFPHSKFLNNRIILRYKSDYTNCDILGLTL